MFLLHLLFCTSLGARQQNFLSYIRMMITVTSSVYTNSDTDWSDSEINSSF